MICDRQTVLLLMLGLGTGSTCARSALSTCADTQTLLPKEANSQEKSIPRQSTLTRRDARDVVRSKLRQHVRLHLDGISLTEFRQLLEEVLECSVTLDHVRLAQVRVDPDTTFLNASFNDIQINAALRKILPPRLGIYVDEGLLVISSIDKAQEQVFTRVYECADLLRTDRKLLQALERLQALGLTKGSNDDATAETTAIKGFVSQVGPVFPFHGPRPWVISPVPARDMTPEERLIDIILRMPSSTGIEGWSDEGTGNGSLKIFAGRLIISQTLERHEEIESLLNSLRASRADEAPGLVRSAVQ
ncbi:MAG: hypothetical protein MPJ50_03345 [Pirellulales bacterium]|nr:hypothetical protein [Pirellulales bacterium]